jgi:hypothetical protein
MRLVLRQNPCQIDMLTALKADNTVRHITTIPPQLDAISLSPASQARSTQVSRQLASNTRSETTIITQWLMYMQMRVLSQIQHPKQVQDTAHKDQQTPRGLSGTMKVTEPIGTIEAVM